MDGRDSTHRRPCVTAVRREVGTKVTFPDKRDIGISYCRLLLHDTLLGEDAFRTGTSDTPICECGLDMESAEHFLLHCTRHHFFTRDYGFISMYKSFVSIRKYSFGTKME